MVPMNSSTGMPLRTVTFLKCWPAVSPATACLGGACAKAVPCFPNPPKEARKAPAVNKTKNVFFKVATRGMDFRTTNGGEGRDSHLYLLGLASHRRRQNLTRKPVW